MAEESRSRANNIGHEAVRLFGVASLLLAILFVSGSVASLGRSLADFVGICLLLAFLLTYVPRGITYAQPEAGENQLSKRFGALSEPRLKLYSFLVIAFALTCALVLTGNVAAGLLGTALLVFAVDLASKRAAQAPGEMAPLLLTVMLFSLYILMAAYVPAFGRFLNGGAQFVSSVTGHILGREINIGATYSGLYIVVLFALFFIASFSLSRDRRLLTEVGLFLSLLAAYVVYIAAWSFIFGSSLPGHLGLAQPFVAPNDFWPLLFALLLVPTFFMLRTVRFKVVRLAPTANDIKRLAPAMVVLLLGVLLLAVQTPGRSRSKEIVFYDNGSLDWRVPGYAALGLKNAGMFGFLPEYLGRIGYFSRTESVLTKDVLERTGTLVLINLNHKLGAGEKKAIWDFVDGGGSLLVMGDHTGREVIREPFNDLLKPVDVSFNFDAAIPLNDRWRGGGLELRPHPVFTGIDSGELQVNIGASISVGAGAKPLILGRYGFSDTGNLLARANGYLGNMKFSADERLGDLVLAAEARHGKGKVLVFGDTSSFQNGALPYSYRFVDNVFAWLGSSGGGTLHPYHAIVAVMLLAAALVLLFLAESSTFSFMAFAIVLAVAVLVSSSVSGAPGTGEHGLLGNGAAIIDVSHLERVSQEPLKEDSVDGLAANLIRGGYAPMLMKRFSPAVVENSKVLVEVAPARSFSQGEVTSIKSFLNRGGLMFVTVGSEEYDGSASLLARFGLSVEDIPLGQVTPATPGNVSGATLWKAWPVSVEDTGTSRVLSRAWDYPVIVDQQYGSGGIVVAGDSSFLLNRNLEEINAGNAGNINFLKDCLGREKTAVIGK